MTLEEIKSTCDVIEGYMDLGLFDEALEVMRKLPPDLRIANNSAEILGLTQFGLAKKSDNFHQIIRPSSRSVSIDPHA